MDLRNLKWKKDPYYMLHRYTAIHRLLKKEKNYNKFITTKF